jgi:hypothetical protein
MSRYVNKSDVSDTHVTVTISGPPDLAKAVWSAITETGITIDGDENIRPAYITDGNFSENRRAPGEISIRYAKLIYHTSE